MRFPRRDESGFTIVEVLVAVSVFAIVSIGFYQVMFSGVRGSDTTRDVARISEEARLGLNRLIRDTREARAIFSADSDSYEIEVDYNADGNIDYGQFERIRYTYNSADGTITLAAYDGTGYGPEEVLVRGVSLLNANRPVFDYGSNHLEYDYKTDNGGTYSSWPTPGDGLTSWEEINDPPSGVTAVGDRDAPPELDGTELNYISNVTYAFRITAGSRSSNFVGEAQLRNRRFGVQ